MFEISKDCLVSLQSSNKSHFNSKLFFFGNKSHKMFYDSLVNV